MLLPLKRRDVVAEPVVSQAMSRQEGCEWCPLSKIKGRKEPPLFLGNFGECVPQPLFWCTAKKPNQVIS